MKNFRKQIHFTQEDVDLIAKTAKHFSNNQKRLFKIDNALLIDIIKAFNLTALIWIDAYVNDEYQNEFDDFHPSLSSLNKNEIKKLTNWIRHNPSLIPHWEHIYFQLYPKLENNDSYTSTDKCIHFSNEKNQFEKLKGVCFYIMYLAGIQTLKDTAGINDEDYEHVNKIIPLLLMISAYQKDFHALCSLVTKYNNEFAEKEFKIPNDVITLIRDVAEHIGENYMTPGCIFSAQAFLFLGHYQKIMEPKKVVEHCYYKAIYYNYLAEYLLPHSSNYIHELYLGKTINSYLDLKYKSFEKSRHHIIDFLTNQHTTIKDISPFIDNERLNAKIKMKEILKHCDNHQSLNPIKSSSVQTPRF